MDEIDDLLSELKAEYGQSKPEKSLAKKTPPVQKPLTQPSSPLDYLLAEVKEELTQEKPAKQYNSISQSSSNQKNNLLQELQQEEGKNKSFFKQQLSVSESSSNRDNNLLQELQTEFKEQEKLEQQHKQQEEREKQCLEEQRQQRKQLALQRQAQEWLNKLNPNSEEGRWFEEFSYSYDSKLQAAIHYLEALRETGN